MYLYGHTTNTMLNVTQIFTPSRNNSDQTLALLPYQKTDTYGSYWLVAIGTPILYQASRFTWPLKKFV